jgi:hypothetical protein
MKNLLPCFLLVPFLSFSQLNIQHIDNQCPVEDVLRVCIETEPYAGLYEYETIYSFCGTDDKTLTGEIEMIVNSRGQYYVDDFSFGAWAECYNETEGTLGTVEMRAECSFISGIFGTDRFGSVWSSNNFSFENNSFSFNWFNTYGEFGTTTLTPVDGRILNDPTEVLEEENYQVLWSTGETTSTISTNDIGLFQVTVTSNQSGETEIASITIGDDELTLSEECNGEILDVSYFLDTNENGIQDPDEVTLNVGDSYIEFSPGYKIKGFVGSQIERFVLEPQTYKISFVNGYYRTTMSSNDLTMVEDSGINILNVGMVPVQNIESIDVNITAMHFQRCEAIIPYRVRVQNNGTQAYNGEFSVVIDPLIDIVSYDLDPIKEIDKILTWQVNIPNPTEYIDITLYLNLPSSDYIGEILCISPIVEAFTKAYNDFCFELVCAHDPNDKQGIPMRGGENEILKDESLDYTIRFENLGNDTAFIVIVTDRLSSNFDLRTFKLLSASHEVTSHWIDTNRNLHVEFENIMLPSIEQDSTLNKGFFQFTIDLIPGLSENTKINNTASIYFDQNKAVVTNTTNHTLVSQIGTTSTSKLNNILLSLSPNPVESMLNLTLEHSYLNGGFEGFLVVYDVTGNLVLTHKNIENPIDVSHLKNGIYYLRIYGKNGAIGTTKFIKIN